MKKIILFFACSCFAVSAFSAEKEIPVPSDTKAKYTVVKITGNHPIRTIVTRHVSPHGESFTKRTYNCQHNTYKELETGATLEKMRASKPKHDEKYHAIVPKSVVYYVGKAACEVHK